MMIFSSLLGFLFFSLLINVFTSLDRETAVGNYRGCEEVVMFCGSNPLIIFVVSRKQKGINLIAR